MDWFALSAKHRLLRVAHYLVYTVRQGMHLTAPSYGRAAPVECMFRWCKCHKVLCNSIHSRHTSGKDGAFLHMPVIKMKPAGPDKSGAGVGSGRERHSREAAGRDEGRLDPGRRWVRQQHCLPTPNPRLCPPSLINTDFLQS